MLNYTVDPRLLAPLVPPGTEIDFENGETFLSVVGFLFLDTRLLGLPNPLHRDFEEVNLRFYVKRKSADTWRRGVVFIRELVPRHAIALIARACYGENYLAVPMKHEIEHVDSDVKVEFSWRRRRKWESLKMSATGQPQSIPPEAMPNSSLNITGVTLLFAAAAANIESSIPGGRFGTRVSSDLQQTLQLFTANNSLRH